MSSTYESYAFYMGSNLIMIKYFKSNESNWCSKDQVDLINIKFYNNFDKKYKIFRKYSLLIYQKTN